MSSNFLFSHNFSCSLGPILCLRCNLVLCTNVHTYVHVRMYYVYVQCIDMYVYVCEYVHVLFEDVLDWFFAMLFTVKDTILFSVHYRQYKILVHTLLVCFETDL